MRADRDRGFPPRPYLTDRRDGRLPSGPATSGRVKGVGGASHPPQTADAVIESGRPPNCSDRRGVVAGPLRLVRVSPPPGPPGSTTTPRSKIQGLEETPLTGTQNAPYSTLGRGRLGGVSNPLQVRRRNLGLGVGPRAPTDPQKDPESTDSRTSG